MPITANDENPPNVFQLDCDTNCFAFREQCQELREAQTKRRVLQISEERAAQIRSQQECALARQREEDMFHQMWQADAHAKEERERREASDARHCSQMQMDFLCEQMAGAERLRQRERLARQEESRQEVSWDFFFLYDV